MGPDSLFSPSCPWGCPQIDQVKQDLSRKDTELLGLQTKLETLTNQFSDSKQHIEVLKESLTAKEQRAAILQTEVLVCSVSPGAVSTFQNIKHLGVMFHPSTYVFINLL